MLEKEKIALFDMVTADLSFSSLIENIQKKIFDNPIMITNTYFKVIAMSTDTDFNDDVWNYAKKYHCCSKESILSFREDSASKRLFSQNKSFLYKTNLGKNIPRILGRIAKNNVVYGYIIIFEINHKLEDIDIQKSNLVCKVLCPLLASKTTNDSIYNSRREYFYLNLLHINENNKLEIENEILQFQWDFKSYFQVLSIICPTDKSHYIYLSNEINKIAQDVTSFIYADQILTVLNFNDENIKNTYIKQIQQLLIDFPVKIGISRTFYDLSELKVYFHQALRARELGVLIHKNEILYPFYQYEYYDMIAHYPSKEWPSLICNEYHLLKTYDTVNHTQLLQTCITYFLTGSKVSKAAQELGIHRNTLLYRLSTIEEIIRKNSSDVKVLDLIYHSHLIDQLMQVRDSSIYDPDS